MIWLLIILIMISSYGLANVDYMGLHEKIWLLNKNNHYNTLFSTFTDITSSNYVIYDESNLRSVTSKNLQLNNNNNMMWKISFTGIPNYDQYIASNIITSLNNRPKAYKEFQNGLTILKTNDFIRFGDNIGYYIQQQQENLCNFGYWPPDTTCPNAYHGEYSFPLNPSIELNLDGCYIPYDKKKPLGYAVNGIPLLGLIDDVDKSYNNQNIWHIINHEYEKYHFDLCSGSSTHGKYYHYSYSQCLALRLNDSGLSHSPVYGIASDGYPIYGPWQNRNILANSCWKIRDYQYKTGTGGGCIDNLRSCILIDPENPRKGTKDVIFQGPGFQDIISLKDSSLEIITNIGIFIEDYYYDRECYLNQDSFHYKLDKHNGHTHENDIDNIGYHYHFTIDETMNSVFPYIIGPKYYGCVKGSSCKSSIVIDNNSSIKLSQCSKYDSTSEYLITNSEFHTNLTSNTIVSLSYNVTNDNDSDINDDVIMTNIIIGSIFGSIFLISFLLSIIFIIICICCPKKTIVYKISRKVIPT